MITHVAFDADDTLWHSEGHYRDAQAAYEKLLADYIDIANADVHARLLDVERRNIKRFGYGAKGMTLSMVEAAIAMTEARISATDIQRIVDLGVAVLEHPVELLPGIVDAVADVAKDFTLLLITKGDLFHQEAKIAKSGLSNWFHRIEIVSEKDGPTYRRVLDEVGIRPEQFLMVGNSPGSDIAPVLELGASAVYVPYHLLWAMEQGKGFDTASARLRTVASAAEIPAAVRALAA
ncbi:MAG: HAD family hydrolase [Rhodanobacteraceae bacterium]|jgi:putative hydrolase of the HAD superfamily|nr:HAD family hydrolase [Rhodanobacteraceae bacterium]MBL0041995.1 HAD family hydrolase [Xanthomonadales bacterium]MBP6077504.1 HAD family hydrolase [Xanthomonadales bacterium]MBP7623619.1 HAD family hydrolase [Xanthomonadales bacterium]